MPPPIPPPPPQPDEAETRLAVRLVAKVALGALAFFLALSALYTPSGRLMDYGRENPPAWMLWKVDRLDHTALRAHEGGRVLWLVGSSILRESFDEEALNAALAERRSPWRVQKFGLSRGAAGLSSGLLERLPVRAGDRVMHSVSMDNFHEDWLEFSDIPDSWLMALLSRRVVWETRELPVQKRIELVLAAPWRYWALQEDMVNAWWEWVNAPLYGLPRPRKVSRFVTFRQTEEHANLAEARAQGEESYNHVSPDETDWSETQFNAAGIARMRAFAAARGANFTLVDIPPRQEYVRDFLHPEVRAQWTAWKAAQPDLVYFPQLPEDDFYDLRHPNFRGRARMNEVLVEWLAQTTASGDATPHEETPR